MLFPVPFFFRRVAAGEPDVAFVTAQTGSGVATLTWDNSPEQTGDFVLLLGANNSGGSRTVSGILTLDSGSPGTNTGALLAHGVLATGSDTLTVNATMTRLRATCWRNASQILDWDISFGNGTSVPGVALTIGSEPRARVYDWIYCETAGLTISGFTTLTQISVQTAGASWRDGVTAAMGAATTYTPDTATLSGSGGDWVRISVAIE